MALKVVRVAGRSMEPLYRDGDYLLVWTSKRFFKPKVGDAIVFRRPDVGLLVKQVEAIDAEDGSYRVRGLHPDSVDSREFGAVPSPDVIGKALKRFSRPRSRL